MDLVANRADGHSTLENDYGAVPKMRTDIF
jgi:hypothetical protein